MWREVKTEREREASTDRHRHRHRYTRTHIHRLALCRDRGYRADSKAASNQTAALDVKLKGRVLWQRRSEGAQVPKVVLGHLLTVKHQRFLGPLQLCRQRLEKLRQPVVEKVHV